MDTKIYECSLCGKTVALIKEGNPKTICCGQEMKELKPQTIGEKGYNGHTVKISKKWGRYCLSVGFDSEHPQSADHHIEWIIVEFEDGILIKRFRVWEDVRVCLRACSIEKPIAVYVKCNIHGLYKTPLGIK